MLSHLWVFGRICDLFYLDIVNGTVQRVLVDPGALFGDGFESGDVSDWSSSL